MTQPVEALSVDAAEDLLPLSVLLRQRGIQHRIFEEAGRQVMQVSSEHDAQVVRDAYREWRSGTLEIRLVRQAPEPGASPLNWLLHTPVTIALIVLSIAGFALFYLSPVPELLALFTYTPFTVVEGRPLFSSGEGQYWRLVTPAFLHFGWLHIAFNSLWAWELGRRIEVVLGSVQFLLLFLVTAIVSNVSQFLFGGPGLFGGMSGVVYGLLGFSWIGNLVNPDWPIRPLNGVLLMMLGWLVFCLVGVVEFLGFGAVANAAHLGGLVAGAALGGALGLVSRSR